MVIGVPREVKDNEHRVAITPEGVMALVRNGHRVLVEKNAGVGSGISDADFVRAGALIVDSKEELFKEAEMIVKVKEPLPAEYELFHEGQILFTYLHLASSYKLTKALMERDIICVAYETVEKDGYLPLLEPMSEIAGRASIVVGAYLLSKVGGGPGVLISGVPGVLPAKVVIIGGGVVGLNAAKLASGLRAETVIFEINPKRLRYLEDVLPPNVKLRVSSEYSIAEELEDADLLIGAVLVPGAKAPKVVTREMIRSIRKGAVAIDVAIDQGGCFETSLPTTHSEPTFEAEGVVHYCVTNIPGIYPRTSTYALTQATLPYILKLASLGIRAFEEDEALAKGVNIFRGRVTNRGVAEVHNLEYVTIYKALAAGD